MCQRSLEPKAVLEYADSDVQVLRVRRLLPCLEGARCDKVEVLVTGKDHSTASKFKKRPDTGGLQGHLAPGKPHAAQDWQQHIEQL